MKHKTGIRSTINSRLILFIFENVKPEVLTLLDRYKVPFYHHKLEDKWGYLVSKNGQQRREPFRVTLKTLKYERPAVREPLVLRLSKTLLRFLYDDAYIYVYIYIYMHY